MEYNKYGFWDDDELSPTYGQYIVPEDMEVA